MQGVKLRVAKLKVGTAPLIVKRGIGQCPRLVLRQIAGSVDTVFDKLLQFRLVEPVGGVGAETPVHKEADAQTVFGGLLQAVNLHVAYLEGCA
ncbi:hypothetical protein Barb7_02918 [Bacteroidales bacterium Barb7]|nr:hypothetical protein Barb7_02918 [Bacteroidales bacterium Barb7]